MFSADGVEHDAGVFVSCWCRGMCKVGRGPIQTKCANNCIHINSNRDFTECTDLPFLIKKTSMKLKVCHHLKFTHYVHVIVYEYQIEVDEVKQ